MQQKSILALLLFGLLATPARGLEPFELAPPQFVDEGDFYGGAPTAKLPVHTGFGTLGSIWQIYALTGAAILTGITIGTSPAQAGDLDRLQFRLNLVQGVPLGMLQLVLLAALCTDPELEGRRLQSLPVLLMPTLMFLAGWLTSRQVMLSLRDRNQAWTPWAGAAAGAAASTAVILPILALEAQFE